MGIRVGFSEEVNFKLSPEIREGAHSVKTREKSIPGRETCQYNGSKMEIEPKIFRREQEASVAGG